MQPAILGIRFWLLPALLPFSPVSIFNSVYSRIIIVGVLQGERKREKTTPVFPGMNCRGGNRRSCGCWAQLMWMEQQCYRLAPSALSVSHLTRTVALSWSMLPFSEAGVRGPECKGYPTLHISWVGREWGWKSMAEAPESPFHPSHRWLLDEDHLASPSSQRS